MAATTALHDLAQNVTSGNLSLMHYLERHGSVDAFYAFHNPGVVIASKWTTPVWYVIGFPCNLLAFIVWIQPRMRPSSGCFLAALALTDLIFLLLQLSFKMQETYSFTVLHFPVVCEAFPVFFLATQYLSPLLVLGFTTERYISICHPFQREKLCTTRRAQLVITCMAGGCIIIHMIQAWFWTYNRDIKPEPECEVRAAAIKHHPASIWNVWTWLTEMLGFLVVPLTILILNILVIREARRISKQQNAAHSSSLLHPHKSSATTMTLLAVSFFLIFTTLPVTIIYCLALNFRPGNAYLSDSAIQTDPGWQQYFTYLIIKAVINELGMAHYACNFFIYIFTGKQFRRELLIFGYNLCWKSKLRQMRREMFLKEIHYGAEFHSACRGDTDNGTTMAFL